jgi:hypothetical protein
MRHHAMKTYGAMEVRLHAFLTSELYGVIHAPVALIPVPFE